MITRDRDQSARQCVLSAVGKSKTRSRRQLPQPRLMRQQPFECDSSQANHHAEILQQFHLLVEPWCAVALLLGCRFVSRRSATHHGGYPKIGHLHSVIEPCSLRLRRESGFTKDGKQKIPRSVAVS